MKKFVLLCIFFTFSCAHNVRSFQFTATEKNSQYQMENKKLLILFPIDKRKIGNDVRPPNIHAIPFFLWWTYEFERPDNLHYFGFRPKEDIAWALRDEYETYKFFSSITIGETIDAKKYDYYINTEISEIKNTEVNTFYGISFYGIYPMLLGLPVEFIKNSVKLKISIIEPKTNKIIYEYEPEKKYIIINGLYYDKGRVKGYNVLFKEIIEEFTEKSLIEIKRHLTSTSR